MSRYRLPAVLGGGEYPGELADDGSFVVIDVDGWQIALPLDLITEVPPTAGLRLDLAEQVPARIGDYNGRRELSIERSANGTMARIQVVEGEQFGRAALLTADAAERAGWTLIALVDDLRAGAR